MLTRKCLLLAIVASLLCCGTASAASAKRIVFANYFGPTHPNTKAMEFFKEKIEKDSKGAFAVTLKPNNEIGGEEKILEFAKRGTIQIGMVGGYLKDDEPMIAAWEQPFIIDGWDHARAVFFDPAIKKFEGAYTEKTKCYIKGYVVNGFRQVSCNYQIAKMSDFGRMKIRTPLNEVFVKLFSALGANPTPLPMTELYTALETKVVDGQDNPYSTVKAMGWWEVQPYLLEARHIFSPTFVIVNGKFYDGLSAEHKKIFDEALTAAIKYNWDISEQDEQDAIAFLKEKKITITIPDEEFKTQMRAASKGVYEWFDSAVPSSKEFRDFCASKK